MSFYLASSLKQCPRDLNVLTPPFARRGTSDGWVGDTDHQARKSDHNPDYDSGGVVRAIDLDVVTGALEGKGMAVVAAAIAHPATQYVIHVGSIWNRKDGFRRRVYSGHPHSQHVHISIRHTREAETTTDRWWSPGITFVLGDRVLYLTNPQMVGDDVRLVQEWAGLTGADMDRAYGPKTEAAVKAKQEAVGLEPDGRVGPATVEYITSPPEEDNVMAGYAREDLKYDVREVLRDQFQKDGEAYNALSGEVLRQVGRHVQPVKAELAALHAALVASVPSGEALVEAAHEGARRALAELPGEPVETEGDV